MVFLKRLVYSFGAFLINIALWIGSSSLFFSITGTGGYPLDWMLISLLVCLLVMSFVSGLAQPKAKHNIFIAILFAPGNWYIVTCFFMPIKKDTHLALPFLMAASFLLTWLGMAIRERFRNKTNNSKIEQSKN